jgi:hypothetical protein
MEKGHLAVQQHGKLIDYLGKYADQRLDLDGREIKT